MRKGIPGILLAAALALSVSNAAAAPFRFSNLYDNWGAFEDIIPDGPALNNSGTVAFVGAVETGGRLEFGIFTGSGGPATTILSANTGFFDFGSPSLNNSGTVAFRGQRTTGETGIFAGSGGPLTTIAHSSGPFTGEFGAPSLNDSGTVAFFGAVETGGQLESGIFTGSGGPITTIADSSGPLRGFFGDVSLNNSGTVAFTAATAGARGERIIFTASGGTLTTIARGPVGFGPISSSLNDSGTVASLGSAETNGQFEDGIFTGSGGATTTVADTSGPYVAFDFGASINNSGTVVFVGILGPDEQGTFTRGVFTGPDPTANEVISVGDRLFGSTVTEFQIDSESLNDTDQIAFFYQLADGRSGIALAVPRAIPEPGTIALLGFGLAGLGITRRRRAA